MDHARVYLVFVDLTYPLLSSCICGVLAACPKLQAWSGFTLSLRGELYCDSTGCCDEEEEGLGVIIGLRMVEGGDF